MLDFLDKLRAKPIAVRKQIAVVTTVLLSALVVVIWWGSRNVYSSSVVAGTIRQPSPVDVVAGVFHGVKDKTVSSWNDVQSEIKDVAENPEFMPEVPLGERGVFTEESAHTQEITAIDESAL